MKQRLHTLSKNSKRPDDLSLLDERNGRSQGLVFADYRSELIKQTLRWYKITNMAVIVAVTCTAKSLAAKLKVVGLSPAELDVNEASH